MGCLQQTSFPVPALVTMSSLPHLAQRYLLPISLAISNPLRNTVARGIIILGCDLVNFTFSGGFLNLGDAHHVIALTKLHMCMEGTFAEKPRSLQAESDFMKQVLKL
jgi:hypothetical protein